MKKIIDISKDWLFSADEAVNGKALSSARASLPFFHSAVTMPEGTFSALWTPSEDEDGKTVYLEFSQISGDAEIYLDGNLIGTHKGSSCSFRVLLSLEVTLGQEYKIEVKVTPKARADAMFVFASVSLICVDSSHFNMTDFGNGLYAHYSLNGNTAEITINSQVIRPNNYDVVSYTVTDMQGNTVFSKTCKPTEPVCSFSVEAPEYWDGQSGAYLYKINARLLRDSRCLDETETDFGIREISYSNDGFLYLNGFRLPLCGISLTDCSYIKTDSAYLKELDGNILISSLLPSKTNLLSLTDKQGMLFWYILPYSGDIENDKEILREFLLLYRNHPSLAGVVFSAEADAGYFDCLSAELKKYAPKTEAVLQKNIDCAAENIPANAKIILLTVPYSSSPDAFISVSGRFSDLQNSLKDKYFAIIPEGTAKTKASPEEMNDWHIKLWNTFCRQKNVIAYFGGLLTDGKDTDSFRGLINNSRKLCYDAFWYYRSQFSSKSFIRICDISEKETENKFTDIKCITNCSNLRILINGKDKKHKAEKITDGVYIFRQIKLKKDVNLIEVSGDNEYDSTEIIRY